MAEITKKKPPLKKNIRAKNQPSFRYDIVLLVLLGISALVAYSQCFKFSFTNWDENRFIFETPMIQKLSWANIRQMFTTKVLMSYNPLVVLSFALDYSIVKTSPGWYHGINVLLHVINSMLLFACIRKLTGSMVISSIASFLFALHPLHVESVAWVASRKDVLYSLFFFLSWLFYLQYGSSGERKKYLFSIFFFLLALLAKSQAMILPFILLMSDYYRARQWKWQRMTDKIPYFILAVIFGLVAVSGSHASADLFAKAFTFPEKIYYSVIAFGMYLLKFVLPFSQSAIYNFPAEGSSDFILELLFSMVLTGLLVYFARKLFRNNLLFAFGLAFFAIAIGPTLHLVVRNSSLIYERFSYISYIGLSLSAASLMVTRNGEFRKNFSWLFPAALMVFAYLTYDRTSVWKDNVSLWSDVIEKNPYSNEAYNNLGNYYREGGDGEKAFPLYTRAIEVNPGHPDAYNNRSIVYFNRGDVAGALKDNSVALQLYPSSAEANNNRGIYHLEKYPDSTIYYCTKALSFNPNFALAYHNRGIAYYKKEMHEEAIRDYQKSIVLVPSFERSYQYEVLAYVKMNKMDEAENAARMAVKINPKSEAMHSLSYELLQKGNSYLQRNEIDSALTCYQRAADVTPNYTEVWFNMAVCSYKKREFDMAKKFCEKTLQLSPGDKDATSMLQELNAMK